MVDSASLYPLSGRCEGWQTAHTHSAGASFGSGIFSLVVLLSLPWFRDRCRSLRAKADKPQAEASSAAFFEKARAAYIRRACPALAFPGFWSKLPELRCQNFLQGEVTHSLITMLNCSSGEVPKAKWDATKWNNQSARSNSKGCQYACKCNASRFPLPRVEVWRLLHIYIWPFWMNVLAF